MKSQKVRHTRDVRNAQVPKSVRQSDSRSRIKEMAKKLRALKVGCDCAVIKYERVPHPKYGDKVPYFENRTVMDTQCIHRRGAIAEAAQVMAESITEAPSVDEESQTEPEGTPGTAEDSEPVAAKCTALKKDGARCTRNAVPGFDGYCRQHGE